MSENNTPEIKNRKLLIVNCTLKDNKLVKTEPKSVKEFLVDFKPTESDSEWCPVELEDTDEEEEEEDYEPKPKSRKKPRAQAVDLSKNTGEKKYIQLKYNKEWENFDEYKEWLTASVMGSAYFSCKLCKSDNRCRKAEIEKHMVSKKHKRNANTSQFTEQKIVQEVEVELPQTPTNSKQSLESESGNTSESTSKRKSYFHKKYKKEWESIPAYKHWLSESVLGHVYFYCKFCKDDNKCGKAEIEKHMISKKHIKNSTLLQCKVQRKFTFRGLLCPVFTPFYTSREINYSVIPDYAKFLKTCGVKGILLNDVTGEGMSLTCMERMKLTEEWATVCQQLNLHLMVQIGGAPLKEVQEMMRHAEKKKVNSVALLPDVFNKPEDHLELMRYINTVSISADSVPLVFYHYPTYTNVNIDVTRLLSDIIGEIDSFVGVIFRDDRLDKAVSALQVNEDKFTVFIGTDEVMLGAVASGFNSLIGTTLNFLPKVAQTIFEAVRLGNMKDAKESQVLLKNAINAICRHGQWLPAMKTAMNILTPINVGPVREPLVTLWQDNIGKMKTDLQALSISTWLNNSNEVVVKLE